ncbi:hypothetical protein RFI_30303 [Reticulomyxa filosa]|uniref:Uncharacterized protein n=1 Tax=Reticulomyxa filosa TaxID=46433 RepID=X6M101_RETFI|nr:hypothetical protein RFI_30303 [Reticulomyxa filosa]|eukprot:ETO07092.1 hypothetical protein RFI_30303 [Reticulomyxa filosa]
MVQRYANPETAGPRIWKMQAMKTNRDRWIRLTPNKKIYDIEIKNVIDEFIKCGYKPELVKKNFEYIYMDTEEYKQQRLETLERRKEWLEFPKIVSRFNITDNYDTKKEEQLDQIINNKIKWTKSAKPNIYRIIRGINSGRQITGDL